MHACGVGFRVLATIVVAALLTACGAAPGPTGPGGSTAAAPAATGAGAFAGRTFRLDLPADWAVLGTPAYDGTIDATPDVAAWLEALDLAGSNAFRAYEPVAGAGGLRLADQPRVPLARLG